MAEMSFSNKVYSLVSKIPKGKVTTYREIALKLDVKAYQAIGQVLKKNPNAPQVPCHRVVKSDGSLGGYKGSLITEKVELLESEGIIITNGKIDLKLFLHSFG